MSCQNGPDGRSRHYSCGRRGAAGGTVVTRPSVSGQVQGGSMESTTVPVRRWLVQRPGAVVGRTHGGGVAVATGLVLRVGSAGAEQVVCAVGPFPVMRRRRGVRVRRRTASAGRLGPRKGATGAVLVLASRRLTLRCGSVGQARGGGEVFAGRPGRRGPSRTALADDVPPGIWSDRSSALRRSSRSRARSWRRGCPRR